MRDSPKRQVFYDRPAADLLRAKDLAAEEAEQLRTDASRVIEKNGLDRERILRELREAMRTVRA